MAAPLYRTPPGFPSRITATAVRIGEEPVRHASRCASTALTDRPRNPRFRHWSSLLAAQLEHQFAAGGKLLDGFLQFQHRKEIGIGRRAWIIKAADNQGGMLLDDPLVPEIGKRLLRAATRRLRAHALGDIEGEPAPPQRQEKLLHQLLRHRPGADVAGHDGYQPRSKGAKKCLERTLVAGAQPFEPVGPKLRCKIRFGHVSPTVAAGSRHCAMPSQNTICDAM